MPRANPASSFEASARHLFRHITDANVLRTNPLVRSYFSAAKSDDAPILEEIHAEILRQAEILSNSGADGRGLRARRWREIVAALCAGERAEETATRLRMSRSHYYRERNAICVRIARSLRRSAASANAHVVGSDDPLRLLFRRAETLRDGGCSNAAVTLLEDAYRSIPEDALSAAVSLVLAEELRFLGRHDRAKELLVRSRAFGATEVESATSEWLYDTWALNKARLESQLFRNEDSGADLELLAKRRVADRRSDDVTFDAVFLSGEWHRNAGRYGEARNMLRDLRALGQGARLPAKRQIAISLLAAYCAEDSTDEFGLAEQSFGDALELCVSSGNVLGALLALSGLINHKASSGRDDDALAMAHQALRIAQGVDFDGFLGFIAAEIVGALLRTRHWRFVEPLVFQAEKLTAPESLARALLKRAQGNFLSGIGRRHEARAILHEAYDAAKKYGNRRLEGLILRDRALALAGANVENDRKELIAEAVRLIDLFGSAGDQLITYETAAQILADDRSRRYARQARAALFAHAEALYDPSAQHPAERKSQQALRLPPRSQPRDR